MAPSLSCHTPKGTLMPIQLRNGVQSARFLLLHLPHPAQQQQQPQAAPLVRNQVPAPIQQVQQQQEALLTMRAQYAILAEVFQRPWHSLPLIVCYSDSSMGFDTNSFSKVFPLAYFSLHTSSRIGTRCIKWTLSTTRTISYGPVPLRRGHCARPLHLTSYPFHSCCFPQFSP